MQIDPSDVDKIAKLARLHLTEDQAQAAASQLSQIVDMMSQLASVDTTGVEPLVHAVELTNVLALDRVAKSLPRESALANAPQRDEECFRVPNVL
jgi:aspartyl-tRNA(Asn)/glutamyl-tRNA(Gln) amidotransferase subunit C